MKKLGNDILVGYNIVIIRKQINTHKYERH